MEGRSVSPSRNERPRRSKARAGAVQLAPGVEHRELLTGDGREPVEACGQPAGAGELEHLPGLRAAAQVGQGLHAQERAQGREQADAASLGLLDAGIGALQGTQGLAAAERQHAEGEMTIGAQEAPARGMHASPRRLASRALRLTPQRRRRVEPMAEEKHRHGIGQARRIGQAGGGGKLGVGALRLAEHQGHQAGRATHDEPGQQRGVAGGRTGKPHR
jgi:hypothetical protein